QVYLLCRRHGSHDHLYDHYHLLGNGSLSSGSPMAHRCINNCLQSCVDPRAPAILRTDKILVDP
ncbi:hypothetical protein BGX34_006730, partial [Mortierella sp. NVP85]